MPGSAEKALKKLYEEEVSATPVKPDFVGADIANEPEPDSRKSLILRDFGTPEVAIGHLVSEVGFRDLPKNLTYDDFSLLLQGVGKLKQAMVWMAGDLLLACSDRIGEAYSQIADLCGYDDQMMQVAESLARSYPYEYRHPKLEWTFHQVVKALAPGCREHLSRPLPDCPKCAPGLAEREDWLIQCEEHGWSREDLRERLRKAQGREKRGPGRPRNPDSKTPPRAKKMDEKAVAALLSDKVEPKLKAAIKLGRTFLERAQTMQENLTLNGQTSPAEAQRIAAAAEKLGEEAMEVARSMLELRRHALVLASYVPPPRQQKTKTEKPPIQSKQKRRKRRLEGDPIPAA